MLALLVGFLGMIGSQPDTAIAPTDSSRILTVNRILIIGNKITKERIISREIRLKTGDTITLKRLPHELLWDKRKIYNLRLFHTVDVRSLELPGDRIDLLVDVTERWYTFPIPIFELSDRNFSEWWRNYNHDFTRINYGINLTQYNCRGRYETLQLIAQFGFSERFELSYKIPYIDKKQKQGLTFYFNYAKPKNLAYFTDNHILQYLKFNETLRVTKEVSVNYFYRKSFFETHSVLVGYKDSQVNDTIVKLNPNYFGNGNSALRYGYLSYTFNSEHRDVVQYPLHGYQVNGFISRTGLGFESKVNLLEMGLSYARHMEIGKQLFISNYSGVYWATPNAQPYALYNGMGYRRQYVRGFENIVVETPALAINKTTLKKRVLYKVWRVGLMPKEQLQYFPLSIYLKTFTDWGYAQNYPYYNNYLDPKTNVPSPLNTRLTDKIIGGYGFGMDFVTVYDLVIRTEYTFTNQGRTGFFLSLRKEF